MKNYKTHLSSKRHKTTNEKTCDNRCVNNDNKYVNTKLEKSVKREYNDAICEYCGDKFFNHASLSRHKKVCSKDILVKKLLEEKEKLSKENNDMKIKMDKLTDRLTEDNK